MKKTNKRGITLISLVITVIILLILATVAINLAVNSEGLFTKTGQAANSWNSSVGEEQTKLQNLLEMADSVGPRDPVAKYITETSTVAGVEKERTAPIPKGYVASKATGENTIAGGLVIYETDTDVDDSNRDEAVTEYNQYVWIPVDDINSMVMCKQNAEGSVCNLTQEANGELKCTTHGSKDLAGRLYKTIFDRVKTDLEDEAGNPIYKYVSEIDFTKKNQTYDVEAGYVVLEPALVTGEEATLLTQMQSDFNSMAASVAKYGGFYISRYEVGTNGTSKKGQTVLNNTGTTNWYTMQRTLRKTGTNMTSQMIWGSQFYQIIKFIGEEALEPHMDRNLNVEPAISGNNPDDEMMNIYDFEGNYFEWSMLRSSLDDRRRTGGYSDVSWSVDEFSDICEWYPATREWGDDPTETDGTLSTRAALFINM